MPVRPSSTVSFGVILTGVTGAWTVALACGANCAAVIPVTPPRTTSLREGSGQAALAAAPLAALHLICSTWHTHRQNRSLGIGEIFPLMPVNDPASFRSNGCRRYPQQGAVHLDIGSLHRAGRVAQSSPGTGLWSVQRWTVVSIIIFTETTLPILCSLEKTGGTCSHMSPQRTHVPGEGD